MKRIFVFSLLSLLMTGCTAAQMQATKIRDVYNQANAEAKACFLNVYHNPDYESIVPHFPENGLQPTMEQLEDETRPTKQESRLLVKFHDDLLPCRQTILGKIEGVTPTIAQELTEEMFKGDQIAMKLIKRKITWGEAVRQRQELQLQTKKNLISAGQQINSALAASHQAEIAQRIAIFQAWEDARHSNNSQYTQPIQPVQVQQDQPTTTNCRVIGNMVRCNSY